MIDRRSLLKLAVSGVAAASVSVPEVAATDAGWRTPRRDGGNTAAAPSGPTDGVRENWSSNVDVVGTPVVVDGTVYAATSGGVRVFDASNGDELRRFGGGFDTPVSYADGSVFATADAVTYAFDAETGEQEWSRRGTGASSTAPKVADGNVYVGVSSTLYALGFHTGTILWNEDVGAPLAGPPAVHDGTVYAGTEGGDVYAFDSDGGIDWRGDVAASLAAAPVVTDEGVFAVGGRGDVRRFSPDGDDEWNESLTASVSVAPAVDDDYVYVATDEGTVHALRTSSGWRDWSFEADDDGAGAPAVGGDTVYAVLGRRLHALDASDGSRLWQHDNVSGSPAVVDGELFLGEGSLRVLTDAVASPDTSVVEASLGETTVEAGGSVDVTASLENAGEEDGIHQATLYVDDEAVEFRDVDVPAGGSAETTFTVTFPEAGEREVRVDDIEAGTVDVTGDAGESGDEGDESDENTTDPSSSTNGSDDTDDGASLPGFAVPATVVALAAVAVKNLVASDEDS